MSVKKRWKPSGFGERLRVLREMRNWTQDELAEKSGLHKMTVSKIERGVQEPAWPAVVALCKALQISSDAFLA